MSTVRNSIANLAGFAISAAVGLFYTPYIVKHLGVTSYGVVPLVMSLFVFAGWISLSVNWSVGRYITLAYAKGELDDVRRIFNTSLVASLGVFVVIMITAVGCVPFIERALKLPPGTESAARFLLLSGAVSTSFAIICGVLEVGFFCVNRFDYRAIMQVVRGLGSVGAVLLLFAVFGPKLEWVGLGGCVVTVLGTIASYVWNRRLIPALQIKLSDFSFHWFKQMVATNCWIVLDQLGVILTLNINLLLVNHFLGAITSAEFALATQWETLLRSIMNALTVFTPTYILMVGKNDILGLRTTSRYAARFVSILMAIAGGTLIGFSEPLVRIWLHQEAPGVAPLIMGLTLPLIINAAANPLYGVWHAFNQVRLPSFATVITGVLSVSLSLLFAYFTKLGPWSMILGSAIAFTGRNMVFSVFYASKLMQESAWVFIATMIRSVIGATFLCFSGMWLSSQVNPHNWVSLAACVLGVALAAIPFFAYFVLEREDRLALKDWMSVKYNMLIVRL